MSRTLLFRWYDGWLQRAPLRTKMATSTTLAATGDQIVQRCFPAPEQEPVAASTGSSAPASATRPTAAAVDYVRTARQMTWSAMFAPVLHNWFNLLAKVKPVGGVPAVVCVSRRSGLALGRVCMPPCARAGVCSICRQAIHNWHKHTQRKKSPRGGKGRER